MPQGFCLSLPQGFPVVAVGSGGSGARSSRWRCAVHITYVHVGVRLVPSRVREAAPRHRRAACSRGKRPAQQGGEARRREWVKAESACKGGAESAGPPSACPYAALPRSGEPEQHLRMVLESREHLPMLHFFTPKRPAKPAAVTERHGKMSPRGQVFLGSLGLWLGSLGEIVLSHWTEGVESI